MKLLNLVILFKYAVSMIYEENRLDSKKKWRIVYDDERAPSKVACAQKALYFKGEAIYDKKKCQVIKEDGVVNELGPVARKYSQMVCSSLFHFITVVSIIFDKMATKFPKNS